MTLRAAMLSLLFALAPASVAAQPLGRLVETGEAPWPDGAIGQVVPVDGVRPATVGALRSRRALVSVHLGAGVDVGLAREVLGWSEEALDALEFRHGFPAPLPDGHHGGDPTLDVYLTADGAPAETVVDALDATWIWDRASAFVRVRASLDRGAMKRALVEALARAIVLGVKADHPPAYVAAMGAAMGRMVTREAPDLAALRAFQAQPERAFFGGEHGDLEGRGASLFFDLLAARWDDENHKLVKGLLWAPVRRTPVGGVRLWDEPDVFDVARRMFRDEPEGIEGALMEFASARAVLGTAADVYDLAGVRDAGLAVRPVRVVRYGEIPKWVTPTEMLEPTGCATVVIDLDDAPLQASMALWFHGSPWQRWMVRAMRIGRDGLAARELASPVIAPSGEWSLQMDVLDGYTRVLVVVLNLGDLGYEPDVPQSANGFFALNIGSGERGADAGRRRDPAARNPVSP